MAYGKDGGYRADQGPQLVNYALTYSAFDYLRRMISLGAIEGTLGKMHVAEVLRPVMDAMHVVLAGGEVKVEIVRRGNPDIFHELQARYDQATKDSNEINEKSGYYVTLS